MELHERLSTPGLPATNGWNGNGGDPFAEIKNRIHLALISELGPRLFDIADTEAVRARIEAEIRDQLQHWESLTSAERHQTACLLKSLAEANDSVPASDDQATRAES